MCPKISLIVLTLCLSFALSAQQFGSQNKFKQLDELATPNTYRTASGAPGHAYWQQQADYKMDIVLDDESRKLSGESEITYYNNSPDVLDYIWIQLDQNVRAQNSMASQIRTGSMDDQVSERTLKNYFSEYDGGFKLDYVKDGSGEDLPYTINQTMMRIDLDEPLKPGENTVFRIKWWYHVNDRLNEAGGRSGCEYFEEDDNYIYTIAQFYPRLAVYSDFEGWQNKQFLGRGEFALVFGDFDVNITVPSDHVVGATGELQNTQEVLSRQQKERFDRARTATEPVLIVTEEEARKAEKGRASDTKTWSFHAVNVRDFAFASSRKFIWDAMGVKTGDKQALAMSFYPKEGNPLWEQYSTKVVAHTLKTYSKYTFDYPYPVAISVHTKWMGMEYPMICFNGGRPEKDGTYSEGTKWSMIGVIIHEVGHNYFPMIVNSDERQWTWMDEGLNTFLQGVAEREWDHDHPRWSGNPANIVGYMKGDPEKISPIMSNSGSILQFNSNAYAKPAVALNILRETVMGRELFDFAFKHYAQRWMFKHPTPEDFFRTMEDASAVDLDWFWRGWFYGTDHVDIDLTGVKLFTPDTKDPEIENALKKQEEEQGPEHVSVTRNRESISSALDADASLRDFYDSYDPYEVTKRDKEAYKRYVEGLTEEEKVWMDPDNYFYTLWFENKGGLVMPLILEFTFEDGSKELIRVPAEIWRRDNFKISKTFLFHKPVIAIQLDPFLETADTDTYNNRWPRIPDQTRFQLYKRQYRSRPNPMQQ